MRVSPEELWAKALGGPVRALVANQAAATILRHQLYRYRAKISKQNRAAVGHGATEYDHLSIRIDKQPNGQYAVEIGAGTVDILSVEDLGG